MLNDGAALYDAIATGDINNILEITNVYKPNFNSIRKYNSEENILIVCGNNANIVNVLLNIYTNEMSASYKVDALMNAAIYDYQQVINLLLDRCSAEILDDFSKSWVFTNVTENKKRNYEPLNHTPDPDNNSKKRKLN